MTIITQLVPNGLVGAQLIPCALVGASQGVNITPPDGFGYTTPFGIQYDAGSNRYVLGGFDVSIMAPTGPVAYYVSTTGNDANDGLSAGAPLRLIQTALAKADVDVVYVKAGHYTKGYNWMDGPVRNVSVIATGGRVVSSTHQAGLTWALDGTYTNTYKTIRTGTQNCVDTGIIDVNGDYSALTLQASAADVDANPGSWYTDATLVYVRLSDDGVATGTRVRVYTGISNGRISAGAHVYAENIDFEGGLSGAALVGGTAPGQDTRGYFKNCTFKYTRLYNGLTVGATSLVICQGCVSARNGKDGFNYHVSLGAAGNAIEIDCVSRDNYTVTENTNQASSAHDGAKIVRINGEYYGPGGQTIADVLGAYSWNLGCHTYNAMAGQPNWVADSATKMWCERCTSSGASVDWSALATTYIYKRLCVGAASDSGPGVVAGY
jgi:hypothetical protein